MKTTQLTGFPSGLITDVCIPVEDFTPQKTHASSEALTAYLNGALAVILGSTILFGGYFAWAGNDLHKAIHGRMSYLECTKTIFLHAVSPERGVEYQLSKTRATRGPNRKR